MENLTFNSRNMLLCEIGDILVDNEGSFLITKKTQYEIFFLCLNDIRLKPLSTGSFSRNKLAWGNPSYWSILPISETT
jgi:RNA-binding protein YlmH